MLVEVANHQAPAEQFDTIYLALDAPPAMLVVSILPDGATEVSRGAQGLIPCAEPFQRFIVGQPVRHFDFVGVKQFIPHSYHLGFMQ
ncbi:hypothetical protein [Ruegeria faecimaris]|uniref:hypothetical protein n=1 Tax=Ruegeria faecimaris TaxID=686389 RepID=UPI0024924135|nr:hypothetical protein [Ruegeria faecimaris]